MTDKTRSVVIVGAAAAGTATALHLRAKGFGGQITLVGEESVLAYDRPPLSKGVLLGTTDISQVGLTTAEELESRSIQTALGVRAVGVDIRARVISTSDGREFPYDALVIATGASPRRLADFEGLSNAHVLRTDEDSKRLGAAIAPGTRLGVVGGGLIGLEVAASARKRGLDVTVIEPATLPLADRLTRPVAEWLAAQHRSHGVDLRFGETIAEVVSSQGRATELVLSGGAVVAVDEVLVSIGATPSVGWLEHSGLELNNGVVCDEFHQAADGVYVVGDVANMFHPVYGAHVRMETRTNATEAPLNLATAIATGQERPYAPMPFFWTDQYDFKLQAFGMVGAEDELRFEDGTTFEDERWILTCWRDGRLSAVVARGVGKPVLVWRRKLQEGFDQVRKERMEVAL